MPAHTLHSSPLYAPLAQRVEQYERAFVDILPERKKAMVKLAGFVEEKVKRGLSAKLLFICTHNSRRSHISQIWAQAAAAHYRVPNIIAFSGGTEVTAFDRRAVKAMSGLGFKINTSADGINPMYEVSFDDSGVAINAFSKRYDDAVNPIKGFAAIMTCSHADQNCPVIPGAALRIATPYDDPKNFDGTLYEEEEYMARAEEIGRDLLFAFSLVKDVVRD